jgi:hypothetical protein
VTGKFSTSEFSTWSKHAFVGRNNSLTLSDLLLTKSGFLTYLFPISKMKIRIVCAECSNVLPVRLSHAQTSTVLDVVALASTAPSSAAVSAADGTSHSLQTNHFKRDFYDLLV